MYKKFLGEGVSGKCYELANGSVLKIFKTAVDISESEKYDYFSKYQCDSILFPYKLKKTNKYIKGYITKKAPGEVLQKNFKKYSLEKMSDDVVKLEKDILYISNAKIMMYDVHSDNVLYDGNMFSVVDPYEYEISTLPEDDIFYMNLKKLKMMFFDLIYSEIIKTDYKDELVNEIRKYYIYDYEANQMLNDVKYILEYYYQKEIIKLEDIGDKHGNMHIRTYGSRKN